MVKRSSSATLVAALALAMVPGTAQATVANAAQPSTPSVNGVVNTVDRLGSTVYIGGSFTRVTDAAGKTHRRLGAAAFNASTGRVLRWNPKVRGEVRDLEAARQGIYLGGAFSRVGTSARGNLARVNRVSGAVHQGFKVRANGAVNTIELSPGRVYLGGDFRKVSGKVRHRAAAVKRKGSFKLTAWAPQARNGSVHDLVRQGANLFIAGEFRVLNGSEDQQRLALVDGRRGATIGRFDAPVNRVVTDITASGDRVYGAMGGPTGGAVFAVSSASGAEVWERRLDGDAEAVEVMGGELFVGGHFNRVCTTPAQSNTGTCLDGSDRRDRGASLDPASGVLTSWNPGANGDRGIITLSRIGAGRLAAGGDLTSPRRGLAVFASGS
jgi:hypothetical protein